MTHFIIKSSLLKGELTIPSSKSHTMRAILFAALAKGRSVIRNYLPSSDTNAMIEACRLFGAQLSVNPNANEIEINGLNGSIQHASDVIHAGNSGIILRFCSAVGALSSLPVVITGDYSIRHQRPMQILLDGLNQLGVLASSMRGDGFAPVIIQGPIRSSKVEITGEDSQFVSALLIAAAFAKRPIELKVKNPGEKPWVALTLAWFDQLGIYYTNDEYSCYCLDGQASYEGFNYSVPGDFSSAAFPIAAALVTRSELTLRNLDMNDVQGDKEVISAFQKMGALIEYDPDTQILHVKKQIALVGVELDINNYVDAVTILAVVACYAEGTTYLKNAATARQKECDRLHCITQELKKMGADITEREDGLVIRKSPLKGAHLNSHGDHRLAMSLAVAGLNALGETKIEHAECVAKTFPSFVKDFKDLGANIEENL